MYAGIFRKRRSGLFTARFARDAEARRKDFDDGVIVRDARLVTDSVGNEDVAFRPVDLEVAGPHGSEGYPALQLAMLILQHYHCTLREIQATRIIGRHE